MEIVKPNSNIQFLRWRKVSGVIAICLVIASVSLLFTRGLNFGLDFTGGVSITAAYDQPVSTEKARTNLAEAGFEHAVVQSLSGTDNVSIRLQPKADPAAVKDDGSVNVDRIAADVKSALNTGSATATIKQRSFVGPEVGKSVGKQGIYATIFVAIGIMLYLWIRFERRFAIATLLTEIHDGVVTVGIYALLQRQFDMTVLASVMAVVGYSINDNVVVFDRVRELFRLMRKGDSEQILNRAINSTLSRTIMTSVLTAASMFMLYFFGGPVVHGFALTMLIGIAVGTLSSIFVASPILYWLGVSKEDLMPKPKDSPELERRP